MEVSEKNQTNFWKKDVKRPQGGPYISSSNI